MLLTSSGLVGQEYVSFGQDMCRAMHKRRMQNDACRSRHRNNGANIDEWFLGVLVRKVLTYLFDSLPNVLSDVTHRSFWVCLAINRFLVSR